MIVFRSAVLPKTGSMQPAERDSKEILSSGEEESRNLDEYLDDSEAKNEKMSKKRKIKTTLLRKH